MPPAHFARLPKIRPVILIEHPDFYVVSKPPLWLTHRVKGRVDVPDVLNFMRAETGEEELAPPHRLDRETSGIQLLSRDREAARVFFELFKQRMVSKTYLALATGRVDWQCKEVKAPLGALGLSEQNAVAVRQGVIPDGKPACTDFVILEQRQEYHSRRKEVVSLIQATPRTGRLHQIRAHLHHEGLLMLGDKLYGRDPEAYLQFVQYGQTPELTARLGFARQALHAAKIAFPWAGAQFSCEAALWSDMAEYWNECHPLS